jgi:hypothetical protein
MAGLDKEANASAFSQLDLTRCGVLVGSGMGGLSVFQDGEWLPFCNRFNPLGTCKQLVVRECSRMVSVAALCCGSATAGKNSTGHAHIAQRRPWQRATQLMSNSLACMLGGSHVIFLSAPQWTAHLAPHRACSWI